MHRSVGTALLLTIAALLATSRQSGADEFLLHSGGRLQGEWENRAERSDVYAIRVAGGALVKIARSRVAEVVAQRPEAVEHDRLAPSYADTIDAQWRLAEWCRERDLRPQREIHLRRIVELDPDHVPARLGLGYLHVGGQWVTREQRLQEQGYEFYKGRWRVVQEIELVEQRSKQNQAENEWRGKLKRMRDALPGDSSGKTLRQIAAIRDSQAVPALTEHLAHEPNRNLRLGYVEVLGEIASGSAIAALVRFSVDDRDEEIRIASLEQIVRLRPPGVSLTYLKMLSDGDNLRINRAAFALQQLREPAAVGPLIEALVTFHEQVVHSGGNADSVSSSFSRDSAGGSGSSFMAGGQTEVVRLPAQNQGVLTALTRLAHGPSFGFNQNAWRNWHAVEKSRLETIEARREVGQ